MARQPTIKGVVRPGQGQGKKLGMQTANLEVALAGDLAPGVYDCLVTVEGKKYRGLLYYGINSLTRRDCLEVHLRSFSGDLVGKEITVIPGAFLRPPEHFSDTTALFTALQADLQQASDSLPPLAV
ncbi:MAG: riboflavin kinase [Candidatus Magasanikbacteria bacterium]|nr:riboflavin kinase [Candidatus Magasanikbacteria bacterium]